MELQNNILKQQYSQEMQTKENMLARQILENKDLAHEKITEQIALFRREMMIQFEGLHQTMGGGAYQEPTPPPTNMVAIPGTSSLVTGVVPRTSTTTAKPGILGPAPPMTPIQVVSNQTSDIDYPCPRFSEGDPTDWLCDLKCYFAVQNKREQDYLLIALFHLDRPASKWYQATLRDHPALTFPFFCRRINETLWSLILY